MLQKQSKKEMEKEFSIAGVSCFKGTYKVRWVNSTARIKSLQRKDTNIELLQFDEPGTPLELIETLLAHDWQFPEAVDAVKREANELGFISN